MRVKLINMKIDHNTTSKIYHINDIQCEIRIIKERSRAFCHTLPFKHIPKAILFAMAINCALWINVFPPKVVFSTSVSPCTIFIGVNFD